MGDFHRCLLPVVHRADRKEASAMRGYVVRKGNQHYAVIW